MKYALKRDFTPNFLIYIYIYIYINCGNDEKNQPFYNNQFGSNNCFKPSLIQSNTQVFH